MTSVRRWLAAGVVAAVMLVGPGAGIALAHPTLLFTDPATQSAVASSPEAITLLFNEPVTIGERAVVLMDQSGREVPIGPASLAREGRFVTAAPTHPLPPGTYTVRWRVTGSDGDQVEQEFRFAVGVALPAAATTGGDANQPAWLESALRWLLFGGLAVAVGGLIAGRFTDSARVEQPTLPLIRSWAPAGLVIALVGALGLIAQRLTDARTVAAAWDGSAGVVLLVEAAGLLAALVMVNLGRWALAPLAAVIAAEGVRSHAGTEFGVWGAVLTGAHLAAITIWVGTLFNSVRAVVIWRRVPAAVAWVLASYVRLALWTFLVVVATGVASALVLVPLSQLVSTTYGKVLLIKLALVIGASVAAFAARRIRRDASRSQRLRGVMTAEATLLVIVLAVSAVLVSTPPPRGAALAAAPPPPRGQVVPLGTLAGQIGVSLTASEGVLVVLLSTPRRGDYYSAEPDQQYNLSASLGDTALPLRGCGPGCFYTSAAWRTGDNVVTLRADATGWTGGTTGLIVPWPPQPGVADLAAAVAATRAARTITVYETVTSNTSSAAPEPNRLDLDTGFFLAQEPFADGTAPIATRISPNDLPVRLALGYPAASINVQLTVDEHGRISEEILTDPKHLVTRRLVYASLD
jgi:copper transport protein